ncbi:hypothetical protein BDZ97DRAFT_665146 [Flammula alnicola]|nr:hypothetical protein BDZ97DRAFT_665146 [Flammula alnicola]
MEGNHFFLTSSLRERHNRHSKRAAPAEFFPQNSTEVSYFALHHGDNLKKDLKVFLGARTNEIEVTGKYLMDDIQTRAQLEFSKAILQQLRVRSSSGWKNILDQVRNPQPGKESQLHRVAWHIVA